MSEQALPPAWVLKRDGSRVPFDADRISQALFAATEILERPDAFLARELTDGVLHFLAVEKDDDTLTTAQIAEIVGKTVRELGQPALAEAFAAAPPVAKVAQDIITLHAARDVPPRVLFPKLVREFTQQAIYSRQVLAAQSDGLLDLMGLETPGELSAAIVGAFDSPATALAELRHYVGGCAVFDCPEYGMLQRDDMAAAVARFTGEVKLAARLLGFQTVVNLNSAEPPPGPATWHAGRCSPDKGQRQMKRLWRPSPICYWGDSSHRLQRSPLSAFSGTLASATFGNEPACERLRQVSRLAAEGGQITFVFDRPRRPLLLAAGVDRHYRAVLLSVLLQLPQLAARPGLREDSELFLQKLGSLTRLAVSAGVQKRDYLRRLERIEPSPLTTGFLLERARLVIVPVGLELVAPQFTGRELTAGGAALDFAKQIVTRLRDVLKQEGRATHLEGCVDGHYSFAETENADKGRTLGNAAALKNQLRAAGILHAVAERGMLTLALDKEQAVEERVMATLRQAWETSEVAMMAFGPLA